MARFDQDTAVSAVEIQQLIIDWGYELDANGGLAIASLLTEDCTYLVGGVTYTGHGPVTKFYTDRGERVRKLQKDGVRTQRHTITNLRVLFQDPAHASVTFIIVNYSDEGHPPVLGKTAPTIIADCRMDCRRDPDGEWRISLFDSTPIFVGDDPFLNASVVKS